MKLEKKIIDTLLEEMAGFGFISGHAEVIAEEEPHSARPAADLQICISDRISCTSGKACGSPAMYRVFCEAMEQARKAWIEAGRPAGWALPAEADTGIGRLLIKECPPQNGASTPHVLFICERDEVTDDNSLGRLLMTGIKSDRVNMSEWSPARLEAAY